VEFAQDDEAADHAGLRLVAGIVCAVQRKIVQRGELRFDLIEPGAVEPCTGKFDYGPRLLAPSLFGSLVLWRGGFIPVERVLFLQDVLNSPGNEPSRKSCRCFVSGQLTGFSLPIAENRTFVEAPSARRGAPCPTS
jgi:hypothetical protein